MYGVFRQTLGPWLVRYRWMFVVAIIGAIGAQAFGIALPLLGRWTIHGAIALTRHRHGAPIDGEALSHLFLVAGILFAAVAILRSLSRWAQSTYGERVGQLVLAGLRQKMCRHSARLSYGYFERRAEGKIMIRYIGDSNALRTWLARTAVSFPADVISVLLVLIAVSIISPVLALALVVPLILIVPVVLYVNPIARHWTRQGRKNQTHLCGHLGDMIRDLRRSRALQLEESATIAAEEEINAIADAGIRRISPDALLQASAMGLTTLALGAVVVIGTRLLTEGQIEHGDLLAVVWMTLHMRGPVNRISRANVIHQRAGVAADRIAALLNRPVESRTPDRLDSCGGPGLAVRFHRVSYKNVAGFWVIRRLSAEIEGPGAVLVHDGRSGSARVLLDLLLRIRRPHGGRWYLDETDVRTLSVADIRSTMGLVATPWKEEECERSARMLETLYETRHDEIQQAWQATAAVVPDASLMDLATVIDAVRTGHPAVWRSDPVIGLRMSFALGFLGDPPIVLLDDVFAGCPDDCRQSIVSWVEDASKRKLIWVTAGDAIPAIAFSQRIDLAQATAKRDQDPLEVVADSNRKNGTASMNEHGTNLRCVSRWE